MEKILSLHVGHDASVMYIDNNSFMGLSEERVSRIKNFNGFPKTAIDFIFKEKGISWKEIDKVIITSKSIKYSKSYKNFFFFNFKSFDFSNEVPFYVRIIFLFIKRKTFHNYLKEYLYKNNFNGEIIYYDHHLCHIASSLATYPINNSYLLSLDGGGDGINWSFYSYKNKKLQFLESSKTFYDKQPSIVHDSPADVYSNTTKFLGFQRLKDEGKVMGLSAQGRDIYNKLFKSILTFENGRFISKFGSQKRSYLQNINNLINFLLSGKSYDLLQINYMKKYLKRKFKKEDVSASLQYWCVKIINEFINYLSVKYHFKKENLIVSGGFFSNVLVNQMIKERKDINNIYVTPNMGDGGLVLGGIYLNSSKKYKTKFFSKIANNVFYGNDTTNDLNQINLTKFKTISLTNKDLYKYISKSLIENQVVGIVNGKMEFGPRALGNRSILANPAKNNITNILNNRLKRNDFMPFAPMMLDKDAKKILINYEKSDFSSKFMTVTYFVNRDFKSKLKNIIHFDNTMRVQIINKSNNRLCYGILSEFSKLTKIPCLINTSFNVHEEPIIMNLSQGINALEKNIVDLVVSGNKVISKL